jgi:ABC-type multidrug transport system ATPase subunit
MAPTGGYATIAGRDIRTDLNSIRQDIGICLQHDCLFPDLTVREHLIFFARLKGIFTKMSKVEADEHIDQAIRDVALFEKRNTQSKNLSGGQKRKLSVAIAFCGGSKTVLLDEPTSGMDPFSRRFTWNGTCTYLFLLSNDALFLILFRSSLQLYANTVRIAA